MLKSETAVLVAFVASIEGREATELQVEAWHGIVSDLDHSAAMDAAREHYRAESRRLWPADLRGAVRTQEAQAEVDYEVAGAQVAEGAWSNASRLPREMIRALGEVKHEGTSSALIGMLEHLEVDFDLRRRLKAVE